MSFYYEKHFYNLNHFRIIHHCLSHNLLVGTKKGVWYVTPKGYHIHQHVIKQYYNAHKLTPEQMQLAASEMNRIISLIRKARSISDLSSEDFDRFENARFNWEKVVKKSKNFEPPLRVLYVKNIQGQTIGGNKIQKDIYAVHFTYGQKKPEYKKGAIHHSFI